MTVVALKCWASKILRTFASHNSLTASNPSWQTSFKVELSRTWNWGANGWLLDLSRRDKVNNINIVNNNIVINNNVNNNNNSGTNNNKAFAAKTLAARWLQITLLFMSRFDELHPFTNDLHKLAQKGCSYWTFQIRNNLRLKIYLFLITIE